MAGNTGTKQIRIGRVFRLIRELEIQKALLEKDLEKNLEKEGGYPYNNEFWRVTIGGEIRAMTRIIERLKEEFPEEEK